MFVELGSAVLTKDGEQAGTISRLILDSVTTRARAAVLHKGFLLSHEIEVPLTDLERAPDGTLHVRYDAEQLKALPVFNAANYTAPPPAFLSPEGYAPSGLYWPMGIGGAAPIPLGPTTAGQFPVAESATERGEREALLRQDMEAAVIGEGSAVLSRDGTTIGHLQSLTFDRDTEQLTSLVVRHGLFHSVEQEVPASLVDGLDDGVVSLRVADDDPALGRLARRRDAGAAEPANQADLR